MKIYGNSKSDGFPLLMAAIGALFVACSWAMVHLSGLTLLGGFVVLGLLVALMLMKVQKWDVMSEHEEHAVSAAFPIPGDSDVAAAVQKSPWLPTSAESLPRPVENPKPAVETNAIV